MKASTIKDVPLKFQQENTLQSGTRNCNSASHIPSQHLSLQGLSVTRDKLLSTILIKKPQLQNSNPGILWAASLQGRPPGCLQFFGLKSEQDLTLENPFKLDEPNVPTPILSTIKVPDKTANQQAGPATDSKITQARTEGKTENFPIERRPPRGNQSHNLTREFEHSQFKPANEITSAIDATKDWEDLVIGKTRADRICESFTMTDGHAYTLDRQEDAHCHPCNKFYFIYSLLLAALHPGLTYPKKPRTSRPNFTDHQESLWPSTFY
ncbi:hypothetical protein DSO57_1026843 [Entomophthora muscae]|uniref:Uncharacterized protein n=1 Tax=Entomophthora muscae TaxID=34485 RepID=A0ACC2RSY6_9FUNG|nr:hypothetical protein DSO57_1026843 [Entomophthora muscae]